MRHKTANTQKPRTRKTQLANVWLQNTARERRDQQQIQTTHKCSIMKYNGPSIKSLNQFCPTSPSRAHLFGSLPRTSAALLPTLSRSPLLTQVTTILDYSATHKSHPISPTNTSDYSAHPVEPSDVSQNTMKSQYKPPAHYNLTLTPTQSISNYIHFPGLIFDGGAN